MRFTDTLDTVFALFACITATILVLFVLDTVQSYRAWPYEQACHQARLIPDRRPLSASVACLPSAEIPR